MSARLLGITCVLIAVLFEAVGQLAFKCGADSAASEGGGVSQVWRLWRHRAVLIGIAAFVVEAVLWTMALRLLDVSVAYPAGSLCFIFVALLAHFYLHEHVGRQRWMGVGLILGGVMLIGMS